jgi:hypothetical protein
VSIPKQTGFPALGSTARFVVKIPISGPGCEGLPTPWLLQPRGLVPVVVTTTGLVTSWRRAGVCPAVRHIGHSGHFRSAPGASSGWGLAHLRVEGWRIFGWSFAFTLM